MYYKVFPRLGLICTPVRCCSLRDKQIGEKSMSNSWDATMWPSWIILKIIWRGNVFILSFWPEQTYASPCQRASAFINSVLRAFLLRSTPLTSSSVRAGETRGWSLMDPCRFYPWTTSWPVRSGLPTPFSTTGRSLLLTTWRLQTNCCVWSTMAHFCIQWGEAGLTWRLCPHF